MQLASKVTSRLRRLSESVCRTLECQFFEYEYQPGGDQDDKLAISSMTDSDYDEVVRFIATYNSGRHLAIPRFHDAVRRGFTGCVARNEGRILAYAWYCTSSTSHPQLQAFDFLLQPDEIFGFDLFVAPDVRGGNLPTRAVRAMAAHMLRESSRRCVLTLVDKNNRRSALVHLRSGFLKRADARGFLLFSRVMLGKHGIRWMPRLWL